MIKDSLKLVAILGLFVLTAWLGSIDLKFAVTTLSGMALGGVIVFVGFKSGVLEGGQHEQKRED